MFNCERCGAGLPPDKDQCAYCGTVHEGARAALHAEAAQRKREAAQANAQSAVMRQLMLSATEQASSRALLFGLLSVGFFCLPVFSAFAYVYFNKARDSAQKAGTPLPTRASVGLVLGILTGVLCICSWVYMIADMRADDAHAEARKTALNRQIAARPASPVLDHPLACELAELYLLSNGFEQATNTGAFREVSCLGTLEVRKERAEMPDFSFHVSTNGGVKTATVCFKHGERWFVESLRVNGCELEGAAAPSAAASAR